MSSYIVRKLHENNKKIPNKQGIVETMSKFDVEEFDLKVALSIVRTHRESYKNQQNKKYLKWCMENLEYIEDIYDLSELDCDFNTFYSFVFNNSD